MPRRPRPAHRQQAKNTAPLSSLQKAPVRPTGSSKRRFEPEPSESGDERDSGVEVESQEEFEEGSSHDSDDANESHMEDDVDDDDDDVDAPRVVQWEDDEDFLEQSEDEEDIPDEKSLKNNLQDLPLGALRQAQRILSQAEAESGSESDSDDDGSDEEPAAQDMKGKGKEKIEKVEWSIKKRDDIAKRPSKHAPTEVTSKRPVSRKRQVVEVPKILPRDPRFLPTTGEFSVDKFQQSYGFLAENHKKELQTLREALKQARKALSSSPRELRIEREHEVHRLEQAIKRAESLVNKDRQDQVKRDALKKIKKEESSKRSLGKGEWHLKRGEVQKAVVQARYEALSKEGGQRAVKRAIEKKQKKESQKEKRSRPYAKGEFSGKDNDRPFKRRRV